MSFLILCLPRSRSAWLAHFLNYPLARPLQPVGHDILVECESIQQFLDSYKNGMWGTVETAAMLGWQLIRRELPECKIVLVRRPLVEVVRSFEALGIPVNISELAERDEMLNALGSVRGVKQLSFHDLVAPAACEWLFEYCLELEFDYGWWRDLAPYNIQIDMPARMKQLERNRHRIELMKADLQHRLLEIDGCPLN